MKNLQFKIFVMEGGQLPKRQTPGAIGYDVYLRAIVSPHEMDNKKNHLRKTLFDFNNQPTDQEIKSHIYEVEGELVYRMDPHESVLGGIGFITAMDFPKFYWVAPRSGLASKWGITVTNAPGTVDPDYRGEAGVLIYNRNDYTYDLKRGMRIAQIIFQEALIPELVIQKNYSDLPDTERGPGGFGSTGI
jgi:dUTP pyrophosphatase